MFIHAEARVFQVFSNPINICLHRISELIVKLTPWFTVKAGNSVQADIDWVGENLEDPGFGMYEQTAAVHIQFSEYLAANQTIRMYLIGTESLINRYTSS